jgi:hypothetical protein
MKKMIPVYLLQILMLAAILFIGKQVSNEMASIKIELARGKSTMNTPRSLDEPIMRVQVVNSRPVPVEISR